MGGRSRPWVLGLLQNYSLPRLLLQKSCFRGLILLAALFSREGQSLSSCTNHLQKSPGTNQGPPCGTNTALQCLFFPGGFAASGASDLPQVTFGSVWRYFSL